ncbi:hypothetical protein KFU94_61100 [Chloroflexi bacterium TSY]|nr:hypothetical protein [Chloroflexi bacterium TSY]
MDLLSLQVELPMRTVFESPTVHELALAITELLASDEDDDELLSMIKELQELSGDDLDSVLNAT